MENAFRQAVIDASLRPELRDAVTRIYADLQAKIDLRRPLCVASGRCCKFEEFGHRLFVTTIELAKFVHDLSQAGGTIDSSMAAWTGLGCPFQTGKLCGVHALRPFGCRIFFCDPTATDWQQEQYEAFHGQLKDLHERHQIPYFYMEWRQALRTLEAKTLSQP